MHGPVWALYAENRVLGEMAVMGPSPRLGKGKGRDSQQDSCGEPQCEEHTRADSIAAGRRLR